MAEVLAGYQFDSRVDSLGNIPAPNTAHDHPHSVIAHSKWILHHQALDLTFLQGVNQLWRGIEADELEATSKLFFRNVTSMP